MMLRERRRAATARAGELELSIEANAVKADEAASELRDGPVRGGGRRAGRG
ncbi:MAG: hypothetical protein ACLSDQ_02450 [Adlercreutzia equolifaciens]